MLAVNKWRVAAAHAVLVDKATWDQTHTIVLDTQAARPSDSRRRFRIREGTLATSVPHLSVAARR